MSSSSSAWVLTDGKAGDENQCLAVAEALGLQPLVRRIASRPPFSWAAPWGPVDPRERPRVLGSPIAPPWPDLVIASGRRAVPYLRAIKRCSQGQVFTVYLKDPRTGPGAADLIWAPDYDGIRGRNVVTTLTSPHRMSRTRLAEARARPDPRVAALATPRVAVLIGGDSRHGPFSHPDTERLAAALDSLVHLGASLAVTTSRRTPAKCVAMVHALVSRRGGFLWSGEGDNPYPSMLALADAIVVTTDSINMISEAVATGAPVLAFEASNTSSRHRGFVAELERRGAVRPFHGRLERFDYEKLDSTPVIAEAIAIAFARHRAGLAPDSTGFGRRT